MSVPIARDDVARRGQAGRGPKQYVSRRKTSVVAAWLETQQRDEEGAIVASQRDVSEGTGISLPTVRRALRFLLDEGDLILVELGTGYPYSSRYRLAADDTPATVA